MANAHAVAVELRRLADCLDTSPASEIPSAYVSFSRDYSLTDKEKFLAFVKMMPRPIEKEYTDHEIELVHKGESLAIYARMDRSAVCELVEPAKPAVYRCDPILSLAEEEGMVKA